MSKTRSKSHPHVVTDWTFSTPINIIVGTKEASVSEGESEDQHYAVIQVSRQSLSHSAVLEAMIDSASASFEEDAQSTTPSPKKKQKKPIHPSIEFKQFKPKAFHTFLSLLHNQQFAAAFSSTPVLTQEIVLEVLPIAVFLDVACVLQPTLVWMEANPALATLAAYDSVAPSAPAWTNDYYDIVIKAITEEIKRPKATGTNAQTFVDYCASCRANQNFNSNSNTCGNCGQKKIVSKCGQKAKTRKKLRNLPELKHATAQSWVCLMGALGRLGTF